MKYIQFKNAKTEKQFYEELLKANGKLTAGALTAEHIDYALSEATQEFKLLKKDFDSEMKIRVSPRMDAIAGKYKYSRDFVACTFEFNKSKVVGFKFQRFICGTRGISKVFTLKISETKRALLQARIFRDVEGL